MLDTNAVAGLLDPDDALNRCTTEAVMAWEDRGASFAVSLITWSELRVGAIRRGQAAEDALRGFRVAVIDEILVLSESIAEVAARIRAEDLSVRVPDALILATAHELGVATLLTADRKIAKISPELVQLIRPH
ncbi:type II toxin-antitoxin system VapC family toxin [Microbispora sp. ATCC PTA-5024]|uniref:type II toxin-antitoxin system VapC family toxin n=1 Tax=Microbispora sp. ATCC PTA-5024 TaxID=316330 RepID=UPI001E4FFDA4|nr:PIN domain-containing protein [Microbispora sp. ATCC PTA-5024]